MMPRNVVLISLLIVMAGAGSACDAEMDSPTMPSAGVMIQPVSSDTRLEQIAIRVQLRLRVTEGLDALTNAVGSGAARGEVCIDDQCASDVIVSGRFAGECDTAVGFGAVEMASAWSDGDEVGIDFCVPITTNAETYRTTVSDGQQESNVVATACGQSGGFLTCGPG